MLLLLPLRLSHLFCLRGGNTGGSGSSWLLDSGRLVKRSIDIGKPIIVVGSKSVILLYIESAQLLTVSRNSYRLGLFGFGASPELEADNRDVRDVGVGNYGTDSYSI